MNEQSHNIYTWWLFIFFTHAVILCRVYYKQNMAIFKTSTVMHAITQVRIMRRINGHTLFMVITHYQLQQTIINLKEPLSLLVGVGL